MDRAAILELLDFDDFAWQEIGKLVTAAGGDVATRPAPGSGWPALRDCFGHMIFAYEGWLRRLKGATPERPAEPFAGWRELDDYRQARVDEMRAYIASLTDQQLRSEIEVELWNGSRVAYTPAELLGNLVVHERGHHGDVNTLLYQLGLEPGVPDYRQFVNLRRGYPDED